MSFTKSQRKATVITWTCGECNHKIKQRKEPSSCLNCTNLLALSARQQEQERRNNLRDEFFKQWKPRPIKKCCASCKFYSEWQAMYDDTVEHRCIWLPDKYRSVVQTPHLLEGSHYICKHYE